jgi:xanthine permease XanP
LVKYPPARVLFLSALQHIGVVAPTLVAPLIVARAAGLSGTQLLDFVSLGILGLAAGALLLSLHANYVGTGYLCPATYTNIYFGPSMSAVQHGGLPMVFGMTVAAGVMQLGIAPLMRRLRALMPTKIAGLVIAIIGLNLAANGVRYILGIDAKGASTTRTSWPPRPHC